MKIAVSSTTNTLEGKIDQRFGRCPYFLIIDSETLEFTVIDNESAMTSGGAGIKAAETIVQSNAKVVITGNIGPNAFDVLHQAGIKVFRSSGTVRDTVEKFKAEELEEIKEANVEKHFGGLK